MNTHEYLELVVKSIECIKCGRCCPTSCSHLVQDCCDIHPNQHEVDPKYGACELSPIDLVLYRHIFCPPVIEKIKELTGMSVVNQDNSRFCETVSLEKALLSKVKNYCD